MTELAVTDGMPPPADLPRGECNITRFLDDNGQPAGIRIDRADPRILISGELLDMIRRNDPGYTPETTFERDCVCSSDLTCHHVIGGLLKLRAVNRTVIYRITEYVPRVNGYIGEWPD